MTSTDHDEVFERAETLCVQATEDPSLHPEYTEAHKAAQSLEHRGWKRRTGPMTQTEIVMNHMVKAGSISAREAMIDHGITSATLARRICDLEEQGTPVIRERRKHPITKRQYTRYSLAS